jgi:hypothetical protein
MCNPAIPSVCGRTGGLVPSAGLSAAHVFDNVLGTAPISVPQYYGRNLTSLLLYQGESHPGARTGSSEPPHSAPTMRKGDATRMPGHQAARRSHCRNRSSPPTSAPSASQRYPSASSNLQPRTSNLQFLIDTLPKLEFPVTPTKQSTEATSNRYKTDGCGYLGVKKAKVPSHSSLGNSRIAPARVESLASSSLC